MAGRWTKGVGLCSMKSIRRRYAHFRPRKRRST